MSIETEVTEIRTVLLGVDGSGGMVKTLAALEETNRGISDHLHANDLATAKAQATADEAKDIGLASTRRVAATDRRMWTGLGVMLLAAAGVIADFTLRR